MNQYSFDVHMHTHYSYDSLLSPRTLVRAAVSNELSAIVVTDHNTIRGAAACAEICRTGRYNLRVYVGAEIKTEYGDVIGLILNEEIRARRFHEVVDEIREQDGIVFLPHPFGHHTSLADMDLSRIQVIEAYNGRCSLEKNRQALELGRHAGLPILGGSDAHLQHEVGSVINLTNSDITDEDSLRKVVLEESSRIRVFHGRTPVLPKAMITQYMSWIRTGQSERVLERILMFILRQTMRMSSHST